MTYVSVLCDRLSTGQQLVIIRADIYLASTRHQP